jgi:hypothetical protein
MISFFDIFRWDRFVATSVIELLFWLLAGVSVLLAGYGIFAGLSMLSSSSDIGGLIVIALSIIGGLTGIVAARVLCEAIVILFRINENLLDIRENAGVTPAPTPASAVPQTSAIEDAETALLERKLAESRQQAVRRLEAREHEARRYEPAPEPARSPESRSEPRSWETRAPEPRRPETRSWENRTSETRAPESRTSESRTSEPRASEPRTLEHRAVESRSSEYQALERRLAERKVPEVKPPIARLPEAPPMETPRPIVEPVAARAISRLETASVSVEAVAREAAAASVSPAQEPAEPLINPAELLAAAMFDATPVVIPAALPTETVARRQEPLGSPVPSGSPNAASPKGKNQNRSGGRSKTRAAKSGQARQQAPAGDVSPSGIAGTDNADDAA